MSALAEIYLSKGMAVSGSDLRPNNLTDKLASKGAAIHSGHDAVNLPDDADLVVRSACIRDDNPECVKAKEMNIPVIVRSEMLGKVMEESPFSIAVTGTHGKTTTSALIAHVAEHCGKDPTVLVGGETECFSGNAKVGRGDMTVAEIDESDGHFRNITSTCALITNIEKEHMESYGSMENLIEAYREFTNGISPRGFLVFNSEDPVSTDLAASFSGEKAGFGIEGDPDVTCANYSYDRSVEFDFHVRGKNYGRVKSPLKGRYNLMNILGAMAVCARVGLPFDAIAEAVNSFRGVRRRFDTVGRVGSIEVIEDYAHHPTELKAVISAAKNYSTGRVVSVFQPHRYSRTRDLLREFSDCFYGSDILVLTEIYSADEDRIKGVAVARICDLIDKNRFEKLEIVRKEMIPEFVAGIVKPDDVVLVLGAGDIREISGDIVREIGKRIKEKDSV